MAGSPRPLEPAADLSRVTRHTAAAPPARQALRRVARLVAPRDRATLREFRSARRRSPALRTAPPPTNLGPTRPPLPRFVATTIFRQAESARNRSGSLVPRGNRPLRSIAAPPTRMGRATRVAARIILQARRDAHFPRSPRRVTPPPQPSAVPVVDPPRAPEAGLVDQAREGAALEGVPTSRRNVPKSATVPRNSSR